MGCHEDYMIFYVKCLAQCLVHIKCSVSMSDYGGD